MGVRFSLRRNAVPSPCSCGFGVGIYNNHTNVCPYEVVTTTSIYCHVFQQAQARAGEAIANVLDFKKKHEDDPTDPPGITMTTNKNYSKDIQSSAK